MNITLRAGEKLFINGAVIRLDRKASVELLNDVSFLLENHVMQAQDATTPLRQIYFAVQVMLMDPAAARNATDLAMSLIESAMTTFESPELRAALKGVAGSVARRRYFESLKSLRSLYSAEAAEMFPVAAATPSAA